MAKNPGKTLFQTIMWLVMIPLGILALLLLFAKSVSVLFG